jgi:hypothetical protein
MIRHKERKNCISLESNQRSYGSEPSVLPTELVVFYMKYIASSDGLLLHGEFQRSLFALSSV